VLPCSALYAAPVPVSDLFRTGVNLANELDRYFFDMEKVVSGDASVWGAPVVIDGVHVLPEVECLVPSWLRQEYFARTSGLGLPAGQHYVYPGVRSPLLLPTDYIRKYFSIYAYIYSLVIFNCAILVVFKIGFYSYSCGFDVDGSAVVCSAAGRSCFESAFPVLHSGIFWADCCADSNHREVSFHFPFFLYWLFLRFRFLCILLLLAAVDT
jgi:hypothetical protein